jgi:hypothetical protein
MNQHVRRTIWRSLAVSLFAVAALPGCVEQEVSVSTVDQSLAQQMSADSQYMMGLLGGSSGEQRAAKGGEPLAADDGGLRESMPVDLADPAQHRFVMNRLAAAGKNVDNSPQLFEHIRKASDAARARSATSATSATTATATDWCRNFIFLGNEVKTSTTTTQFRTTRPYVTCVGSPSYVYADITTYNSNTAGTENFVVQSAAGEDYTGGASFSAVAITPTLPAVLGRVNKTDSLIISIDDLGREQFTYNAVQSAMTPVPGTITLTHPVHSPWINSGGNIKMCQLRGFPDSCDYAVGNLTGAVFTGWVSPFTGIAGPKLNTGNGATAWAGDTAKYFPFTAPYSAANVYLPTQGTFDVGALPTGPCAITRINSADFRLFKTVNGGSCTTTASFRSALTFTAGARTGTIRKSISTFINDGGTATTGVAVNCSHAAIINEAVRGFVTINAQATCGTASIPRILVLGPDGVGPALKNPLFFLNSCFAEGTAIRRANGKAVAVEKVKVGDKVIADARGTLLTVTGVSQGAEAEPLVEIRDSKGHRLRLTVGHPLVLASGEVVLARKIRQGDKVMTDRGIARVVSTSRVAYDGQVYNLSLGTPEEKARVGKDGTTMFAGGFLAGDANMQQALETPVREVAQLPEVWERDYQNAVAGNPPMQRVLR